MTSLRHSVLITLINLILVTLVASFNCPEDCNCDVIEQSSTPLNHAKCTSIHGFKGEEKNLPIHSLDLSNAKLDRISHTLEKLRDLTNLDLSHNSLSDIGRLGRRIRTLDLSHNKITSGKLTKIPPHVEKLSLNYNEITYLPLEITNLKYLKSIELNGNSLNCTCETLEVRDWLQRHNLNTDQSLTCTYPADVKGAPFWDVKKTSVCEQNLKLMRNDNEIELMLGDEPVINEGSGDAEAVDELGKDFLPVDKTVSTKKSEQLVAEEDVEGSGLPEADIPKIVSHDHEDHAKLTVAEDNAAEVEDEEDEGEGSGGSGFGPLIIPHIIVDPSENDNDTNATTDVYVSENEDDGLSTPIVAPVDETTPVADEIFGAGLGIVEFESTTEALPDEVTEEAIVPVHVDLAAAIPAQPPIRTGKKLDEDAEATEVIDDNTQKANIRTDEASDVQEASTGENKSTYILLGVILLVVLALIVFVAIKRTRARRQSKREADLESQRATELLDMDKKNLGKPIQKNGNAEHAPLIGDLSKSDKAKPINGSKKAPYANEKDPNVQEPLLKQSDSKPAPGSQPESNNNIQQPLPDQTKQETPIPAVRQTQQKSEPEPQNREYPPPSKPKPRPSSGDDEVFLPSSPKTGRYSPVYSPETGRVKIKLLETPKPKTPLLVTRSTSNAGDIITTPTNQQNDHPPPNQ